MQRIVLKFGLIAGAMLSAMMLSTIPFMDKIGFEKAEIIGYGGMVLAFLLVYFGVRSYRDTVNNGHVTFGRAFKVGLLITVVATVCYVATWQLVYYKVAPDFFDKYSVYTVEVARTAGATEAELAEKAQQMAEFKEMYGSPLINIGFTFLEPLPVGLLLTLISAGALSRKRHTQ